MATRGEIKANALSEAGVIQGDAGYDDPFLLDGYVDEAVQEICQYADSHYATWKQDMVSGKVKYCFTGLYFIDLADITRADGTDPTLRRNLQIVKDLDMAIYYPLYRVAAVPDGDPLVLVTFGSGWVELYPPSNYDAVSGLILRGFGVITPDMWPSDADECPMHFMAHNAIKWFVASRIARRARDMTQAAYLWNNYLRSQSQYQEMAGKLTRQHQSRFPAPTITRNPSDPMGLNPFGW